MDTNQVLHDLHIARLKADEAAKAVENFLTTSQEYMDIRDRYEFAKKECLAIEEDARLNLAHIEGAKLKTHGFEVVNKERVEILDEAQAFNWCMDNATIALTLDKKTFIQKFAKSTRLPAGIVAISYEHQVKIATDLGKLFSEGVLEVPVIQNNKA